MQVVGTQRAKPLSSTAGSWFRQRLLEAGRGTGLAGLAYFEIPIPSASGESRQAHAVLFTPAALIVVELRSLPWYRGGVLRVEESGPWTVDGMDAGLGTEDAANPGERVTRLVFALREHLRSAGARDDGVTGLVCVAGPELKVRQDRASLRLGNYLVCAGDHQSIRKAVARLDRGGRRWSVQEVHDALLALHLGFDVPSGAQLAEEAFPEHAPAQPRPRPRQDDGRAEGEADEADDDQPAEVAPEADGRRRTFTPETLIIPAFIVPVVLAVLFLLMLLGWLGQGIGQVFGGA